MTVQNPMSAHEIQTEIANIGPELADLDRQIAELTERRQAKMQAFAGPGGVLNQAYNLAGSTPFEAGDKFYVVGAPRGRGTEYSLREWKPAVVKPLTSIGNEPSEG